MALVKFYRGPLSKYNSVTMNDGVFFATDQGTIHVNGVTYGGFKKELLDGVITNLDVEGQRLKFKKRVNDVYEDVDIELLKAEDSSITIGNIVKENGVIDGSTIKVNVKKVEDVDGLKLGDDGLYVDLTKTNAKIDDEIKDRNTAINSLNVTEQGGAGKFIQSVKEDKGIITAVAADLTATAVNYDKNGDKIIANATDVSAAIKELDVRLADVPGYKVVKLTEEQIKTLTDAANIKEAYEVVSVANEDKARLETRKGEVIKIYKDSALKSIAYVKDNGKKKDTEGYKEGQFLKYVYTLANGDEETVYVDMSELVDQAEVENGIQAINGKLSVKIDDTGEDFLTVSTDGVKLSGVQNAIDKVKNEVIGGATTVTLKGLEGKIEELDTKVQKAHTVVNEKTTGHITVTVADSDDSTHKVVTVDENDIASKEALDKEVARAEGKEQELLNKIGSIESAVAGKFNVIGSNYINVEDKTVTQEGDKGSIRQFTITAKGLATSAALDELTNTVAGHTASINKLNGDKTAEGSVAKTVDDAINSALTWVDVSIDIPQE